jgi:lysozyme family protein
MTIDQQIEALIEREGGYVNHPADRGGPTKFGVTEQVARAFGFTGNMRDLSREMARTIYRQRYWEQPRFDEVFLFYPRVGEEMFDTGVNMGPAVAGRFLQRALNLLNRGATDYPDIGVDGAVGALTLHALNAYRAKRGAAGETVLLRAIDGQQLSRYMDLAEGKPSQEAFLYGWIANRIGSPG